jgi:hypothetical protein
MQPAAPGESACRTADMGAPFQRAPLALLCALCSCAALLGPAAALSWPVCDSSAVEWVTDAPRLTGTYPFSSLLCAAPRLL